MKKFLHPKSINLVTITTDGSTINNSYITFKKTNTLKLDQDIISHTLWNFGSNINLTFLEKGQTSKFKKKYIY